MITYMCNIQYVDHQPSHLDSDILVYEQLFHIVHSFHKDYGQYMGQGIGFLYRPYYLDSQHHVDIHLFELKSI